MIKKKLHNFKFNFKKFSQQKKNCKLPKIFLIYLCVVFLFYLAPIIIDYSKNKSLEYRNNSKTVLAYTLKNEEKNLKENIEVLNENDLLLDIFSLNDLETDTVRLNASTIKQLFEDTNYSLKEVRKKKLVKQ